MRFIDSNVLVYSADPRDAAKQQIAKTIVMSARNSNDYVISAQVINEFANVALNSRAKRDNRRSQYSSRTCRREMRRIRRFFATANG